jgi:hypothetical protein
VSDHFEKIPFRYVDHVKVFKAYMIIYFMIGSEATVMAYNDDDLQDLRDKFIERLGKDKVEDMPG